MNSYCVLCRVNQAPSPRSKPRHEAGSGRSSQASSPSPQYKLHSFSLLNYDRERLERKVLPVTWFHSPSHFSIALRLLYLSLSLSLLAQIADYRKTRQDPPSDLLQQHKEVVHRLQWQKAQLERGPPALLSGNKNSHNTPEKLLHFILCF